MSLINVTNLTFSYEGSFENIFENVSFKMDTNWKLGFTGRNGKGKTTFLNLLLGRYSYEGKIKSDVDFEYFPFIVKDKDKLTIEIIDNILIDYEYWILQRELSKLRIDEDVLYRPFNTLSGGEQIKVLLCTLFLKKGKFLLIDEPTNHLDINSRRIVSKYLNSQKGFILVSHDRMFLDGCVDHILSINRNNIEIQKGNFTSWYENKKRQDNFELSQNEKLKKDIIKLEKSAHRTADWSNKIEGTKYNTKNSGLRPDRGYIGHKSAKMMKRSKNIESRKNLAIENKSKLLKNIEKVDSLKISSLDYHLNQMINLNNVTLCYDEKEICKNINLTVNQGDRIAICGENGCGKSTLLKFIYGNRDIRFLGNFYRPGKLKISYVSQDTSDLKGELNTFAAKSNIEESLFKTILRKLDFSREQFDKNIEDFSSGQKKKVLIARSLCENAHIYLWDEPLNYIDIFSRMQIEKLLVQYSPTIIFVEHDEFFVDKIATKILNLG